MCHRLGRPLRLSLMLFVALAVFGLGPGEPSATPVLRLETGMHTAMIARVSVDASGRTLLTASNDKTARLWDVATGQLLRVLRPPIGEGSEGMLYACALSPDGHWAAVGGWTGFEWDKADSIYLFDTATGQCLRRIPGLPEAILHLTFSRNGARLAACLGGRNGLRIFNPADGRELARDVDYGGQSYGADFDTAGNLATTCYDGQLRVYDPEGRLLARVPAPGGGQPDGIRFSPDGSRLAVGYDDAPRVDVLAMPGLRALPAPDCSGANQSLSSVAWSADGETLSAGGLFILGTRKPIRSWSGRGLGPARDTDLEATDLITGLATPARGGLLWTSGDPAWGQLDGTVRQAEKADLRALNLGLGGTGTSVAFHYSMGGEPFTFELPGRRLAPGTGPGLNAPRIEGLPIQGWYNLATPTLGGRALTLTPYELSRCLAIAPSNDRFLLGASWTLRCFDAQGGLVWMRPVPATPWTVNISLHGALGTAAYADGTIRWYRMSDGKELLAFFPHGDQKRWVLWMPSGYYDCSPGAEDLIGWHVNRGKDQAADFFPASRFRDTYYRPDIIDKVLETLDEGSAITAANAALGGRLPAVSVGRILPPVVGILSPGYGASFSQGTLSVKVSVRHPNGKAIDSVWATVDGRRVETRGLRVQQEAAEQTCTLEVPLPPQDCTVSVFAQSGAAVSEGASLRLRWAAPAANAPAAFVFQPKLYLLAVGVSHYKQKDLSLDYPAKDARDFAATMQRQKGRLYREVEVRLLTDAEASRDAVLEGLEWLERQDTAKDIAALFLAGHGLNDASGQYFFLPYNADPERMKSTMVPDSEFQTTLAKLPGKVLLFLDSCHSGNVLKVKLRGQNDLNRFVNELSSAENGVVVFSASTGRQGSQESPEWGNGAFTKALVEGLSGQADFQKTGRITINMLDLYVSERVKELTKGSQAPTTVKPSAVPDFPIAMTK